MSSLEERAQRAREGSRRKRDVQALEQIERAARGELEQTDGLLELWALVVAHLAEQWPASSIELWVLRLEPLGQRSGALVLGGDAQTRTWAERRYAPGIGEAVRELSDLTGVLIEPLELYR